MFKIIRSKCCGLDVHKTWIYACIGIADSNSRVEYKQARFSSFSKGLKELSEWLAKYECTEVCMESSGKYWIPSSTSSKQPATLHSLIPSTLSPKRATRPIAKMRCGSVISLCAE